MRTAVEQKKYRLDNPERSKSIQKRSYEKNKEKRLSSIKKYRDNNSNKIKSLNRNYYKDNKEAELTRKQTEWQSLKSRFITMYGGKCDCCGEMEPIFLAIDHVNGQAGQKRQHSNTAIREALREYNPNKFRILCHNCNMAVRYNAICPHKRKDK